MYFNESSSYSWDTPVVDILGTDFELITEDLSRDVTVKDVMTHRTGLANPFLPALAGAPIDKADFVRGIRQLPIQGDFRDAWSYNNWMYGLTANLAEAMGGAPWQQLLESRIFDPLGMRDSGILGENVKADDNNVARPYYKVGDTVVALDPALFSIGPLSASGAVASSADDMAKWLTVLANKGAGPSGTPFLEDTQLDTMTSGHMALPSWLSDVFSLWKPTYPVAYPTNNYGYAWFTGSYRGYPMFWHSGGFFAYISYIMVIPDLNLAVFVSTNGPGDRSASVAARELFYIIADQTLGEDPWIDEANPCETDDASEIASLRTQNLETLLNDSSACQSLKDVTRKGAYRTLIAQRDLCQGPEPWLSSSSCSTINPKREVSEVCESVKRRAERSVTPTLNLDNMSLFAGRFKNELYGVAEVTNSTGGLLLQYGLIEGTLQGTQEDNVLLAEVVGPTAFIFQRNGETVYLKLEFKSPVAAHYLVLEISAPDLSSGEVLVFQRE